jgi:hypothetical protein
MMKKKPKTKLVTLEASNTVVFLAILWTLLMCLLVSLGIAAHSLGEAPVKGD